MQKTEAHAFPTRAERDTTPSFEARPARHAILSAWLRLVAGMVMASALVATAQAQAFPSRPITLIVPFPPGGATDVQARALGTAMSKSLGQPVIIVNTPGVAGTLAPATMARSAAADGYTVSFVPASLFRLPHLQKVSYDPRTDFTYIAGVTSYTYGFVVPSTSPWKLADLLAEAKKRPGEISYGSIGIGGSGHIAMERFARENNIKLNFIPFKGAADLTQAAIGGHIQMISDGSLGTMVDTGKLRVIATMGPTRAERFSDAPTLKESGSQVVVHSVLGIAGPKGMPPAVVQVLQDAIREGMNDPTFRKALESQAQPVEYLSSAQYTEFAKNQYESDKTFVQQLGIKLE
jgi:tripartite-type tricarboxylate transporter receptor subunit TctC